MSAWSIMAALLQLHYKCKRNTKYTIVQITAWTHKRTIAGMYCTKCAWSQMSVEPIAEVTDLQVSLLFYVSLKNSPCSSTIVWNTKHTVWFEVFAAAYLFIRFLILNSWKLGLAIWIFWNWIQTLRVILHSINSPENNTYGAKKSLIKNFPPVSLLLWVIQTHQMPQCSLYREIFRTYIGVSVSLKEFHWCHKHA